ncbi:MAG: hypothetical protein R2912_05735 [Eubacteriales bacterium]
MPTKKKKSRVWLWILLTVIAVVVIGLMMLRNAVLRASEAVYTSYTVTAGSVERTITGSGRLASADSETLQLPGGVRVESVAIENGDFVQASDVVATLNVDSLREQAAAVSSELATLDRQISSRSKVSSIKSPVRGRVKYLPAKTGDDVLAVIGEYGALALISTDEKMQLEIATNEPLALYSDVSVRWDGGKATGMIYQKTAEGYLITLTDNGTPYLATAQVFSGDLLLGEGTVTIHAPVAVLASGGEITDVEVKENSFVYANNKLFSLENAPDSASYQSAFADRADKAALYETLLGYIADPHVFAPVDGFVGEVMIERDAETAASASADGLSDALVLHTGGAVKMSIDTDELDIGVVALGQSATVTLDAYPGESFAAAVTHIARIGAASGTITTYPVEVTLGYDARLLEGMNGSTVILTARKDNVPLLPVDLINEDSEGEYVYVQSPDGKSYDRRDITTGLSDGVVAEITSGLAAGDVIWYQDTSAAAPFGAMMTQRNAYAEENGYPTIGGN